MLICYENMFIVNFGSDKSKFFGLPGKALNEISGNAYNVKHVDTKPQMFAVSGIYEIHSSCDIYNQPSVIYAK